MNKSMCMDIDTRKNDGRWVQSTAGKLSLVLLILSIVLIASTWRTMPLFTESFENNIRCIAFGLATNLLGIIVTISFVQFFLDKQTDRSSKKDEIEKIQRYLRILELLVESYIIHYNAIVIPDSKNEHSCVLYHSFEFKDMADIYQPSLYLNDMLFVTRIEVFYEKKERLYEYCMKMIENIEFKYERVLLDIIMEYILVTNEYDMKGGIIGNLKDGDGGKTASQLVTEGILKGDRDYVKDFEKGKLNGNLMAPVVQLYKMMKQEGAIVDRLQKEIDRIERL